MAFKKKQKQKTSGATLERANGVYKEHNIAPNTSICISQNITTRGILLCISLILLTSSPFGPAADNCSDCPPNLLDMYS